MKDLFKKLGLTENEARLYLAALKSSSETITDLAKMAGIKRTSAYSCIDNLKELGLVIESRRSKHKVYTAVDPKVLIEIASRKEKKWQNYKKELKKTLPQLTYLFSQTSQSTKINLYEGIENIWTLREEFFSELRKNKIAFQIGNAEKIYKILGEEKFRRKLTHRRRQISNSKIYIIATSVPDDWEKTSIFDKDFREIKVLTTKQEFQSIIFTTGNKVWLFKIIEPFMGITIESKEIAELMTLMWSLVWNSLPESKEIS